MQGKKHILTPRERVFCSCFVATGNETEAAIKAGFKKEPSLVGQQLLCRDDISEEIRRLHEIRRETMRSCAFSGYERLAFGNISDAVRLLYTDNPTAEQLETMNLYNVAEIKRPKDGAMEIKFFDRLRALEKLEQLDSDDENQNTEALAFYKALEESAKSFDNVSYSDDDVLQETISLNKIAEDEDDI